MSHADGPEDRAFETQERADAAAERERIAELAADDFLDCIGLRSCVRRSSVFERWDAVPMVRGS